ncbi:MAG TPA: winged-helix domain-containing protein [Spirochaetales bacterium]|nr:winged-helix domain-containing protein [Spirochaetales bacterium]HRY56338.1 winged-helix domain-containing protein [Spirochaetia bacterium]HRZ64276.1 winged-helix domain-containing protein [Spirochaetia bacterium]
MVDPVGVALPTLRRLPLYLRLFEERRRAGEEWLSSEVLARRLGLRSIQVRKDLSSVGALGSPKRGFPVQATAETLSLLLRRDSYSSVFLVGAGHLALAFLEDESLSRHGFEVAAVFHPAPAMRGARLGGREVLPLAKLPDLSRRMGVRLAVFAIETEWAAEALEGLGGSEIGGIVDLTGGELAAPRDLAVVRASFGACLSTLVGELSKRPGRAV